MPLSWPSNTWPTTVFEVGGPFFFAVNGAAPNASHSAAAASATAQLRIARGKPTDGSVPDPPWVLCIFFICINIDPLVVFSVIRAPAQTVEFHRVGASHLEFRSALQALDGLAFFKLVIIDVDHRFALWTGRHRLPPI